MENNFTFSNKNTLQIVNYSLVKESLENGELLTKQQIAQMVQLSLQAVNLTIEQMLKTGEVIEKSSGVLGFLKNKKCYVLNENYSFKLTVQFDFDEIIFTVFNYCDKQVFTQSKLLPKNQPVTDFLISSIEEIKKSYKITSCSMALPCIINKGCAYSLPENLKQLENVNLQEIFQKRFNIPFIVQNASNAATFGFCRKNESSIFEKSPLVFVGFEENYPKITTVVEGKQVNGFTDCAGNFSIIKKKQVLSSFSDFQKAEYLTDLVECLVAFLNPEAIYFFKNQLIQSFSAVSVPKTSKLNSQNSAQTNESLQFSNFSESQLVHFLNNFIQKLPVSVQPKIELIDDFFFYCNYGLLTSCKNVSRETFLSQVEQL